MSIARAAVPLPPEEPESTCRLARGSKLVIRLYRVDQKRTANWTGRRRSGWWRLKCRPVCGGLAAQAVASRTYTLLRCRERGGVDEQSPEPADVVQIVPIARLGWIDRFESGLAQIGKMSC